MRVLRRKLPPDVVFVGTGRVRFGVEASQLLNLSQFKSCDIKYTKSTIRIKFREDEGGMRALNFGNKAKKAWCDIFLAAVIAQEGWKPGHYYYRVLQPDEVEVNLNQPARGLAPEKEEEKQEEVSQ
jgi:hypothetical protein